MIRVLCLTVAALSFAAGVGSIARAADRAQHAPRAGHTGVSTRHAKTKHAPAPDPQVDHWLDIAGFGAVAIYKPKVAARGLVLFGSGDGGWNLGVTDMAHQAAALGYWVAGFNTPKFLKALDASGDGACSDADGRLARLGTDLVRRLGLPANTRPLLFGYSSGATVTYAALVADAGHTFGGGISLGFCPDLLMQKPFCAGRGGLTQHKQKQPPFGYVFDRLDTIGVRWIILQGESDQVCNPKFAPEFAAGQKDSRAVMLPKVGHGFGVPKNWMPQYMQSVKALLDASAH